MHNTLPKVTGWLSDWWPLDSEACIFCVTPEFSSLPLPLDSHWMRQMPWMLMPVITWPPAFFSSYSHLIFFFPHLVLLLSSHSFSDWASLFSLKTLFILVQLTQDLPKSCYCWALQLAEILSPLEFLSWLYYSMGICFLVALIFFHAIIQYFVCIIGYLCCYNFLLWSQAYIWYSILHFLWA